MKTLSITLFFCLFWGASVHAQNHIIDSLRAKLATPMQVRERVDLLNELGFAYLYIDTDSCLAIVGRAEQNAKAIEYPSGIVNALIRRGNAYQIRAELVNTLENYTAALQLAEAIGDTLALARVTGTMQNAYRAQCYPSMTNLLILLGKIIFLSCSKPAT